MKPGHGDVQPNLDQRQTQFLKRDVPTGFPYGKDFLSPLLDPMRPRPVPWAQSPQSRVVVPPSGSPSMGPRQIGPPPRGSSCRHQSPPKPAHANPSIEVGPSALASFTSTHSESEISVRGNPPRFRTVENRSKSVPWALTVDNAVIPHTAVEEQHRPDRPSVVASEEIDAMNADALLQQGLSKQRKEHQV